MVSPTKKDRKEEVNDTTTKIDEIKDQGHKERKAKAGSDNEPEGTDTVRSIEGKEEIETVVKGSVSKKKNREEEEVQEAEGR